MKSSKKKTLLLLACISCLFCSCILHAPYKRPCLEIPETWRFEAPSGSTVANIRWWEQFDDEVLNQLILDSLEYNKDLLAATTRVAEFRAELGIVESQLYPQIAANWVQSRQRIPSSFAFGDTGAVAATTAAATATTMTPTTAQPKLSPYTNAYQFLFTLSYETDFWGLVQSRVESSEHQFFAQMEARRTVILGVVSSVASAYVELLKERYELEISIQTLKSRQESYRIALLRFEGGLTSEIEVKQAASEVDSAKVAVIRIEALIPMQENLISILVGRNPSDIPTGKPLIEWKELPEIPTGLPSEILQQRPDLMQAEQLIAAANADIGAARAAFFPNIALTGFYGNESLSLSNLFSGPLLTWQYALTALQPLFTGGRLVNNLELTEAHKQTLIYTYQNAVLNAFKEVEDALINHKKAKMLVDAQRDRVKVLEDYRHLARLEYDNGEKDYLNVLDAERQLFQAQLEFADAQGDVFTTLVEIYRALGGGWVIDADNITRCGIATALQTIPE